MTNLLVTSVGRRGYVVRHLMQARNANDQLFLADRDPYASAFSVSDAHKHASPPDPVARWMPDYIQQNQIDAVLSLHDYETIEIARLAAAHGLPCTHIGPTLAAAETALDKVALYEWLRNSAPHLALHTRTMQVWMQEQHIRPSMWVLKDRWGSASSGLRFLDLRNGGHPIPDPSCDSSQTVVQSLVQGTEYNVDIFLDASSTPVGSVVKKKLRMRGGETDCAEVLVQGVEHIAAASSAAVAGLEIVGNVDIDVMDTSSDTYILDVNPRFGGGYAFSALAGYPAAAAVWHLAAGEEVATFPKPRPLHASKSIDAVRVLA